MQYRKTNVSCVHLDRFGTTGSRAEQEHDRRIRDNAGKNCFNDGSGVERYLPFDASCRPSHG